MCDCCGSKKKMLKPSDEITSTVDPWTQGKPVGSRVMMWKQDPTVGEIGVRKVFLPLKVSEGPRDDKIVIQGLNPVRPDKTGDFLAVKDSVSFDAVHTYAVVRQTVTMYERALAVGKQPAQIRWFWNDGRNSEPIMVYPYGLPNEPNAFYTRTQKALTFGYFTSPVPSSQGAKVYTCRSLDVVSHETGHAILDGIKPDWMLADSPPQTGALHESFGDLTAIFLTLSQLDMVEAVIADTGANLRERSFLVDLAEEFGSKEFGRSDGLRNAANDMKISSAGNEVHNLSCVMTGAVYDILADIFLMTRKPELKDDAMVLHSVAAHVRSLYIRAIVASPDSDALFSHIARAMLNISRNDRDPLEFQDIIQRRFEAREIWVSSSGYPTSKKSWAYTASASVVAGIGTDGTDGRAELLRVQPIGEQHESSLPCGPNCEQDRSRCCVTMKRKCKHGGHRQNGLRSPAAAHESALGVTTRHGSSSKGGRTRGSSSRDRASLPQDWVPEERIRRPGFFPSNSGGRKDGSASVELSRRHNKHPAERAYETRAGRHPGVNGEKSVNSDRQTYAVTRRHTAPRVWSASLRETVL